MKDIILANNLYVVPLHQMMMPGSKSCSCGSEHCSSKGKHPYFRKNWKQVASRDEATVTKWFTKFNQSYNFGVLTGRQNPSNGKYLMIVDIDKVTENNVGFIDLLPKKTVSYQTGSGGYHLWYWVEDPVANSVSRVAEFVDIRGTNGYAVIPPSNHASGLSYGESWFNCDYPIADFPKELLQYRQIPSAPKATTLVLNPIAEVDNSGGGNSTNNKSLYALWLKRPVRDVRVACTSQPNLIPKGLRNQVLHRLLSSDRAKGMEQDGLEKQAEFYRRNWCENPASVSGMEIANTIQSVLRYPAFNNLAPRYSDQIMDEEVHEAHDVFFSMNNLKVEDNPYCFISIAAIKTKYRGKDKLTTQQFSKKLLAMGFQKKHTNKGNVWNVGFRLDNDEA